MRYDIENFGFKQVLKRHLGIYGLIAFGLNYMIPLSPAITFGLILQASHGSVVLPFIIAGIAIFLTANSYILMLPHYPVAGSLYSYVCKGFNPHIGFIAGWTLLLDYILIPTITSLSAIQFFINLFPNTNIELALFIFIFGVGLINLCGIEIMTKISIICLLISEMVVFLGLAVWGHFVAKSAITNLFSLQPFCLSGLHNLGLASSIAILTYLGFDAITTLSEESVNPNKDIPKAIILSIVIGGIIMCLTAYLGILVIPEWQHHIHSPNFVNTTLFFVTYKAGGYGFTVFYTIGYIFAMAIFNVVATTAGSRLLYGMGRDGLLPKSIFGRINQRVKVPHYNIVFMLLIEYALSVNINLNKIAELINFGAITGFIILNFGTWYFYNIKLQDRNIRSTIFPIIANVIMIWILVSMQEITLMVGCSWAVLGAIYGLIASKFYTKIPPHLQF